MSKTYRALVETVEPDSIAAEIGLKPGDEIISINGQTLQDIIDYKFAIADETVKLVARSTENGEWEVEIEKEYDEDLGIGFAEAVFDNIRRCHNACVFCFVDQMPKGMRETLYVKDDDYRMSFLYGNFVTLTNLSDDDYNRIERLRLSPLYVSVHTTDGNLRKKMLNQPKAANIMDQLQRLVDAGIDVHTQIVLCPGFNDGVQLDKTIEDLSNLGPSVLSIAIVPVGLTQYREGLQSLRSFTADEAKAIVKQIEPWQSRFMDDYGDPLVYLSDEFYLAAGLAIPEYDHYGDFPQIENGVGLTRLFINRWETALAQMTSPSDRPRKVTLIAGFSGARVLQPLLDNLQLTNISTQLITIPNSFFGQGVTVTGLLTGRDILRELTDKELGDAVIIPGVTLKQGEEVFLDDLTIAELQSAIHVPVLVAYEPEDLLEKILGV